MPTGFHWLWLSSEAAVLLVLKDYELVSPDLLELCSVFEEWLLKQCLNSWSFGGLDSETLVNELLVGVREGCLCRVFFLRQPVELLTVVVLEHLSGEAFLAEEWSTIGEVIGKQTK